MAKAEHGVEIREAYRVSRPPRWVRRTVNRLLSRIPKEHLAGLKTVVLTDAAGLSHDRRREKTRRRRRKVAIRRAGGLYHHRSYSEPAWIEIFVDNTLSGYPPVLLALPLFRDMALAGTLFHELGHHIHETRSPEHADREDVAERWEKRLTRHYFRRRYWYLVPVAGVMRMIIWPVRRALRLVRSGRRAG